MSQEKLTPQQMWMLTGRPPQKVQLAFGRRVLGLRNFLGYSQRELAERTGLLQHHIVQIEHGRVWPKLQTIQKLAKALNTDLADLVAFDEVS